MSTTTSNTHLRHAGGNWIIGTVNGLTVQAKAFDEPSDDYGMPVERRISKLWVATPGMNDRAPVELFSFDRGDFGKTDLDADALAFIVAEVVKAI